MNKESTKVVIICAVIALVVSLVGVKLFSGSTIVNNTNNTSSVKSTLASVLDKKEIRVGYVVYAPQMIKDANTGALSGIFHDALEEAGKNLGLKINWVEEVSWGTMIEGLQAGRYDMVGSPVWPSAPRATQADFTLPLTYSANSVFARSDDKRFDLSYDAINSPDIRIAAIDGDISATIAAQQFPKAKIVSLPQLSEQSQELLTVSTGKADVTFVEPFFGDEFSQKNAGSVKNVQPTNPLRVNGNAMMVAQGQEEFKAMINVALEEELNSGFIDGLVKKYEVSKNSFYPIAKPFSLPR